MKHLYLFYKMDRSGYMNIKGIYNSQELMLKDVNRQLDQLEQYALERYKGLRQQAELLRLNVVRESLSIAFNGENGDSNHYYSDQGFIIYTSELLESEEDLIKKKGEIEIEF